MKTKEERKTFYLEQIKGMDIYSAHDYIENIIFLIEMGEKLDGDDYDALDVLNKIKKDLESRFGKNE